MKDETGRVLKPDRLDDREGSYLRIVDFCITHVQAERNKEGEEEGMATMIQTRPRPTLSPRTTNGRG